ncbi:hypothetical protein [Kitasatospora sp. NPDC087314]|uniref:hypothetical protein n=1 Tax=Kitasatospora sp. NPDC087314 TaxID=3364068 RepID=UPI003815763F
MTDATSSTPPLPEGPNGSDGPAGLHGPDGPHDTAQDPQRAPKRPRAARLRGWAAGRERRIAAGVAAVALIGAGGLTLAVAHEEHGREGHRAMSRAEGGSSDEHGEHGGNSRRGESGEHGGNAPGEGRAKDGRHHGGGQGRDGEQGKNGGQAGADARLAPAPLPSLAASAALEKAQGAVPGGRAESLRRVTQQGGAAAWAVVVVGPDGVRHLVTVDGTSGELTGNTVVDGSGR